MSADLISKMNNRCFRCMRQISAPGAICSCGYDNRYRSNEPGLLRKGILKNQYFVGKVIGRGGFGITYIGYDAVNDRRVAIKEYFPQDFVGRDRDGNAIHIKDQSQTYLFQEGREKTRKEVETLVKLRDLDNIVDVYEAVEENNTIYIIMEYIDGPALDKYVQKNGALEPKQAYQYIAAVTHAVAQMQEKHGLSHGDISPDNIMLKSGKGGGWTPVLVDFGAVQKVQDEIGTVENKVAKQYYSAPELLNSTGRVNKATDVFSLCVTLYFLLAGELTKTTIDRYIEELPSLRKLGINIGPNLEAAIAKGMALKRKNRCEDARALLDLLSAAVKKDKKIRPEWGMEPDKKKDRKKDIKKDPDIGTNRGKTKSNRQLLIVIAVLAALAAAAAAVVFTVLPAKTENTKKPETAMVMEDKGAVFSWDIPGAVSYDVYLKSSDGSSPVRYNKTKSKNIMIPREDLSSGLRFELEVTAYYEDGSSITVPKEFEIDG